MYRAVKWWGGGVGGAIGVRGEAHARFTSRNIIVQYDGRSMVEIEKTLEDGKNYGNMNK